MNYAMICIGLLLSAANVAAETFNKGPVIEGFGPHAAVPVTSKFDADTRFDVAFDVADQGNIGAVNRKFESLARFLNMQVANGAQPDNIRLALVVHGKAGFDLLSDSEYEDKYGLKNANKALLQALMSNQVRVIICGQSAAFLGIDHASLLPGVEVALSAMTAHARLQQAGYTLNPF